MRSATLCDPYIWENPSVILHTNPLSRNSDCASELVNQIFTTFMLCLVLGGSAFYFTGNSYIPYGIFVVGLAVCATPMIGLIRTRKEREDFTDAQAKVAPTVDVIGSNNEGIESAPYTTKPTTRNPFMNVLIDEMKYNPTRPSATSVLDPTVKLQLNDFFKTEFFNDPTDVFNRTQSQREFITMPSTSIPNDVESYQNWLYRIPGKTCKEGGREACLPGTDGGALPWLNQDS